MKPLATGRAKSLAWAVSPRLLTTGKVQVYVVWNFLCTCEGNDHMMQLSQREHPCVGLFCLSSRPFPRPSTLLCAPRDWPLLSYPLTSAENWREEGERGQLPPALSPITGLVSPPQVSTSCQMALSTQHSLSLVLVTILSCCLGAVTPAVLSPALISVVSLHPAHTFANRPFIQLSLNFPVMSMPFVSYWDLNWPSPLGVPQSLTWFHLQFTLLRDVAPG